MKVRLLKHLLIDGVFVRAGVVERDSLPEEVRDDPELVVVVGQTEPEPVVERTEAEQRQARVREKLRRRDSRGRLMPG
jgi:hypothetical protein